VSSTHPLEVGSFDPLTTKAMGAAFEAACRELHDKGQPRIVRELIAKQIIVAAKTGERDPSRLCDVALQAAGITPRYG
jgi:hypothetical protein